MPAARGSEGEPMIKKLLCSFFILALIFCSAAPIKAIADGSLDEIENYKITVAMEKDGTMDITYHIDWKVLDDTSEGPLSWVKIGIPNQYADNIKALSSSIRNIYYTSDGGDYVRLDLDRNYEANEIVPLDFSIHQSHMYTLDGSSCTYNFTPGWFDDIEVKSLTILWSDSNVQSSDAPSTVDHMLMWTAALSTGERTSASVTYGAGVFTASSEGQAVENGNGTTTKDDTSNTNYDSGNSVDSSDSGDSGIGSAVIAFIVFAVVIFLAIIRRMGGGGGYRGGFGSRGGFIGGGGHCACASSCACACACACAGGGRAGCSAKNFRGAVIQTEELRGLLKKHDGNTEQ
jgi:hypothetical protein